MNGTFRYRLGMAWLLWRTVPEVTLWDAIKMLRYAPLDQATLDWGASLAPYIEANGANVGSFKTLDELRASLKE